MQTNDRGTASDTGRIVVGFDGSDSSPMPWRGRFARPSSPAAPSSVVMTWEWPTSYGWAVPVPDDFDPEADVRKVLDTAVAGVLAEHPA